MISFPKGLNPCNEVVEQIPAESEFIPTLKKKGTDMNKVNVNFFLRRSLVGNILEGDTVFITNIGVCVGAKNKQSSTGK